MNLLHQAGWYRPEDEGVGLLLGAFLIPALLPVLLEGDTMGTPSVAGLTPRRSI